MLGIGFAAWRDVGAFFKTRDGRRHRHAQSGRRSASRTASRRGVSQSGNFLRGWLHLGFNQDEDGSQVHDGMWPIIAGRRIALNFRWAQPDGVLELYQAGSEGPQWWLPHPDPVRGLPAAGILDRCTRDQHLPEDHRALRLRRGLGAEAHARVGGHRRARPTCRCPTNVRRYYIASSNHGGGAGGFDTSLPARRCRTPVAAAPATTSAPACCRPTRCRTPRRSTRCACTSATG